MLRSITLVVTACLVCLTIPVSASIVSFIPESGSISSLDVRDITESHDGTVIFATTNGLSLFDTEWATIQEQPWEYETGLMDNYIQAVEFDAENTLWLGFPGGVQVFNGAEFIRMGKDEFFYTMNIHAILRDGNTIWIANGNSGLSHYAGGEWTWMRPFTQNGPGAYFITSIAKDHATGDIILSSRMNGVWNGKSDNINTTFTPILLDEDEYGIITDVVDYPFGGVILFNKDHILHYSDSAGISSVATPDLLGYEVTRINDVAMTENGIYLIGTDNGMYALSDNEVILHITRNTDEMTSNEVTKVFADTTGRWWFITKGEAGYFLPETMPEKIPVILTGGVSQNPSEITPSADPVQIPVYYS